jgi:hypothetical protein
MDWIMLVLVLSTAPNFAQSQSHYMAGFATEKLCLEAATKFKAGLERPVPGGVTVEVRAVCSERK